MSIAEGLLVESEQFAQMVPTDDLSDALAAWKRRHVHDDPPRDGSFSRHY